VISPPTAKIENEIHRCANSTIVLIALALAACKKEEQAVSAVYQAVPVVRRDIVVSVQAAGTLQPDTTVEVKSKASGEIAQIMVETGQEVRRGDLMVSVDPRTARNTMAQAQARFDVARATLANARSPESARRRALHLAVHHQTEHEAAQLAYANAMADSVSTKVDLENAQIQLE
jgi:multidrug efflux pump subunit AcrA (membrane-fusion protein)